MIAPEDMLVAVTAASLRVPRRRPPRMTRREARYLIDRALAAWPRVRGTLFADIRQVA